MNDQKVNLQQLIDNWTLLSTEIKKNGRFNFDTFNTTFSETYQALSPIASSTGVEKSLLALIVNAYVFANADVRADVEAPYIAALILTERMLNSVALNDSGAQSGEASIYVLESRKEISINFNDANGAVETLSRVIEADIRNKMSM